MLSSGVNDILTKGKVIKMDRMNQCDSLNLTPYDAELPTKLLSSAFEFQIEESNQVINSLIDNITSTASDIGDIGNILSTSDGTRTEDRLVVDVDSETMKKFRDGSIKLVQEHGNFYAQIREKGRYGKKLPIKPESFQVGLGPEAVVMALQIQALQKQMQNLSSQVRQIDQNVHEVLQGQQNDRMALYYSGVALYLESMNVRDPALQTILTSQAMKTLTDSCFQLTMTLKSDVEYLALGKYRMDKAHQSDKMKEKMLEIDKAFETIHQASLLRAGIYLSRGELKASVSVLQEYSAFIEGTIAKNAVLLSQCAVNDSGKEQEGWHRRANLRLDVEAAVRMLESDNNVWYIGQSEEGDNDDKESV